jgi:hypothetical protein
MTRPYIPSILGGVEIVHDSFDVFDRGSAILPIALKG